VNKPGHYLHFPHTAPKNMPGIAQARHHASFQDIPRPHFIRDTLSRDCAFILFILPSKLFPKGRWIIKKGVGT